MALQGGHGALIVDRMNSIDRLDPGHRIAAMRRSFLKLRNGFVSSLPRRHLARKPRRNLCSRKNHSVLAARDEFDFSLDGPIEPPIPKFNREPYVQPPSGMFLSPLPVLEGATLKQRRSRVRRAQPLQAGIGAAIALAFAALTAYGTLNASDSLSKNPPIHNVPNGLTDDMNYLLISLVVGSGGLVVGMFTFTAVGLVLLGYKNFKNPLSSEKGPLLISPSNNIDRKENKVEVNRIK